MLVSLSLIFLYLSGVFQTLQLCFVAAASLFVVVQVIETGLVGGLFVYIGSCVLGLFIVPDKTSIVLFGLFFGYYPLVKSLAERLNNVIIRWLVKLVVTNAALAVILIFFGELIFDLSQAEYGVGVFVAMFNLAFVLYDIGVTKLIAFYMYRIHRKK